MPNAAVDMGEPSRVACCGILRHPLGKTTEALMTNTHDTPHPCGKCAFYAGSIWQPISSGSISVLTQGFSRKELDAGQVLYAQGTENRGVFCVSKGLIALRALHPDGKSTLLKLAYPGDIVGYRSFLENDCHKTEARALQPSRVCTVAQRDANRVMQGNPLVLTKLTGRCVSEINNSRERIISAATLPNRKRLSALLHRLMETHGVRTGDTLRMQLPLSRSDLADLIGVQPETMSRLFKRLSDDGELVISGRDIQMPVPFSSPQICRR
ncbi:Crp/Fnr family transcriptional regulator [Pseudophaeobacter sp.]|uniref:Crp/Fnr family transcriptional regulator n=1 Tax=Pseudophaeobacter sp. TaxID=1971739 RepID=UPI003296D471